MSERAVDLGAGNPDFSGMSMNEAFGFEPGDPNYVGEFPGRIYKEGETMSDPYYLSDEYNFELEDPVRADMYENFAPPLTDQGIRSFDAEGRARPTYPNFEGSFKTAPELYLEDGGSPAFEESGILSALYNAPNAEAQSLVRESGRQDSPGSEIYYPEGTPTFEEVLETRFGYPDVPRDFDAAPEDVRNQRPRYDMPTFQELEDARAHALMSAEMALKFGPETATKLGNFAEGIDALPIPLIGNATPEDVAMDKRNNAVGISLLRKAGVNATLPEIAQMVDQKVFDQLEQILGRGESRPFKSPEGGIDVYFPRDESGYFKTSRSGYY